MTFPETVGETKQEHRWNVNKTPLGIANEAINQPAGYQEPVPCSLIFIVIVNVRKCQRLH